MASRAVQLNISSEDTAHETSLPQSVSSGQISMWPKQLTRLVSEGCRGLRALPCRVPGSWAATRHVSSERRERNNPNKRTSDLNPPPRAFILQSTRQVRAGCTGEGVVR